MPAERLSVRKLGKIQRPHFENGLPGRAIALSCKASSSTVQDYLRRAEVAAKLSWATTRRLREHLDDVALENLLFPHERTPAWARREPDWALVHRELARKHLTTKLIVRQEHLEAHADGMQYSQPCQRYGRWCERLGLVWRRDHRTGERMLADFSGDGITLVGPRPGERSTAKL